MPDVNTPSFFRSPSEFTDYCRCEVKKNGTPDRSGLEEEIIVVSPTGRPLSHVAFQHFVDDVLQTLPGGRSIAGRAIDGKILPVIRGEFRGGFIQPETNTTLIEFAHSPVDDAWGSFRQSHLFTEKLILAAKRHGYFIVGAGAVPTMSWDDFKHGSSVIPNADYEYSVTNMKDDKRLEYCRTVFGTASIHHNMGFNDPEKMARYITTGLRMQPTMIALLGNSPYWDNERVNGENGPILTYRGRVQIDYGKIFGQDGIDYLYPDFLINPDATFAAIIDGYLDLPLDRTLVGKQKVSCPGLTMRDYLHGYERNGQVHFPSVDAMTMMIREPIVDVRPSFTGSGPRVEMRAHDAVSQHCAVALDAFYRGIVANLDRAHELMASLSPYALRQSRRTVCNEGLLARVLHPDPYITTQQDLAVELLTIAEEGLDARGRGESVLLNPLFVLAQSGINPAQRVVAQYSKMPQTPENILNLMHYGQQGFADGTGYQWPEAPPVQHASVRYQKGLECRL